MEGNLFGNLYWMFPLCSFYKKLKCVSLPHNGLPINQIDNKIKYSHLILCFDHMKNVETFLRTAFVHLS